MQKNSYLKLHNSHTKTTKKEAIAIGRAFDDRHKRARSYGKLSRDQLDTIREEALNASVALGLAFKITAEELAEELVISPADARQRLKRLPEGHETMTPTNLERELTYSDSLAEHEALKTYKAVSHIVGNRLRKKGAK